MESNFDENIVMMGINLESQLLSIKKFIKNKKKKKTLILYPDDLNSRHVEKKLKLIDFKNAKFFKYSKDSEILTGQIEKLTNYKRRKINLESRIKKIRRIRITKRYKRIKSTKAKIYFG